MKSEAITTETLMAAALLFVACAGDDQQSASLLTRPDSVLNRNALMSTSPSVPADPELFRKVQAAIAYLSFDEFLGLCQRSLSEEQKLCLLLNLHDYDNRNGQLSAIGSVILDRFTAALGDSMPDLREHLAVIQVKQRLWQA